MLLAITWNISNHVCKWGSQAMNWRSAWFRTQCSCVHMHVRIAGLTAAGEAGASHSTHYVYVGVWALAQEAGGFHNCTWKPIWLYFIGHSCLASCM